MAINPSAVWRVRPSGASNSNGGGFDPGISGAGTDYSQQSAAQLSGSAGTASGTTTFSDATATFTSAMVGNCIQIASGSGFTAGFYFVTGYISAHVVTLDRTPGTGSAAVWKLGGAWADPYTNTNGGGIAPIVGGNIVYILGSGIPNPSSYTYDYSVGGGSGSNAGSATNGCITFANDPNTPNYSTGGMPCIQTNYSFVFGGGSNYLKFVGLWLVYSSNTSSEGIIINAGSVEGCVVDQFGYDIAGMQLTEGVALGCEVFSSVGPISTSASTAITFGYPYADIIGCNVHDTVGNGVGTTNAGPRIFESIIAKCRGDGVTMNTSGASSELKNSTIDDNTGNGVVWTTQADMAFGNCLNNIITNHTQAGKYGQTCQAGTATQNAALFPINDYNSYYGNTNDTNALSYGPHDTHPASASPYVNQAIENYTLA